MKNIRLQFSTAVLLGLAIVVSSCKDDPPAEPEPPRTQSVLVANSGLATEGTGTITSYDPLHKTVNHNTFYKANTYPIGNTLFSILVDGDRTFLVVGGTGEILMVNTETFKLIDRISGFSAPRYITKVAEGKYYVTDWQEDGVWQMRLQNDNTVKIVGDPIPTGKAPEKMIVWDDMVFVANSGSVFSDSTLTVIDAVEDTVIANVLVGHNPNSLQIDKDDLLWVLCSGIEDEENSLASTNGSLFSYNLRHDSLRTYLLRDSMVVQDSLIFDDNQLKPEYLTINADGTVLFFLENNQEASLRRFEIAEGKLSASPFIVGRFNSVAYDPFEKELYLSDPLDRSVDGEVHRFKENGEQLDIFRVGLIPENIAFK